MFLVDVVEKVLENIESHFSRFVLCVFHCFPVPWVYSLRV